VPAALAPRPPADRRPYAKPFATPAFVTESVFSSESVDRKGWGLRFVSTGVVELSVCTYDWESYRQTKRFDCTEAARIERVAVAGRG
jgi:hypothetical protein